MKNVYYILLIISVIWSCGTRKEPISKNEMIVYEFKKNVNDSIYTNKDNNNISYIDQSDRLFLSYPVPKHERNVVDSNHDTLNVSSENIVTINKIDNDEVKKEEVGIIGYNVPNKFKINVYSTIKLRISKENNVDIIVNGDRGISIVEKGSRDKVIIESIAIGDRMKAKLYSDDSSAIIEMVNDNTEQSIGENGYTEWVWRIKPLTNKDNYLKMIITISDKDIVVYEKLIPVESDFWYSFVSWIERWWQVLATTLIIPIIIPIFIYYRKKRKTKDLAK